MADDKQIVVVDSISEQDNYGNLPFKGKDGKDYKIGHKREHLYSQIVEGRAVELIWSTYSGKRYISDAHLVEAGRPLPVPQDNVPPEHKVSSVKPVVETKTEIAPQERGMWWKEVGENFRAKLFNKDDNGAGAYLWRVYVKQMLHSLEITIPIAESKLETEAKKISKEVVH